MADTAAEDGVALLSAGEADGDEVVEYSKRVVVGRGPEPDPYVDNDGYRPIDDRRSENSGGGRTPDYADADDDGDDDDYGPTLTETREKIAAQLKAVIGPDYQKFAVSFSMFLFGLVTFVILAIASEAGGLFCPPKLNHASTARVGSMYTFMNESADVCESFYDSACGAYDARYTDSSLFEETQREIFAGVSGRVSVTIDRTLPENPGYDAMGLFDCVQMSIEPNYINPKNNAVYIWPHCPGCPPQVHHLNPSLITDTPIHLPDAVKALIEHAGALSKDAYWLPPDSGATPMEWMQTECNQTASSAAAQWTALASKSTASLLTTLYEQELDVCCGEALQNTDIGDLMRVVEDVRENILE